LRFFEKLKTQGKEPRQLCFVGGGSLLKAIVDGGFEGSKI